MKPRIENRYERAIYHANLLRHLPLKITRKRCTYRLKIDDNKMLYCRGKKVLATVYGDSFYEMAENLIKELGIDLNSPPEPEPDYTEIENELETKTQTTELDDEPTQS